MSDGKKKLASALLTKGVSIEEEATFAEFYQAILNIPQQLVIGVEKIPGTISYDYHYHVDGNGSVLHTNTCGVSQKGGCYTTPIYHAHSGNSNSGGGCYTVKKTGTKTYGCAGGDCISGPHGPDTSGQVYYVGNCKECGAHLSRYGSPGYQSCSNTKTSTYTYYELGCGKSTNTIVGYRVACGLADGQIIGAHIVYDESAVSSVSAAAVMCYEEVQEMPVYEPEGSTESTEDEPTVSGNEIEPEIEENVSEEPESEKVTEEVTEENESETEESMEDVTEESSDDEKTDMSQEQMQTEQTEPEGAVAEEVTETMVTEEIAEDIQTEVQEEE